MSPSSRLQRKPLASVHLDVASYASSSILSSAFDSSAAPPCPTLVRRCTSDPAALVYPWLQETRSLFQSYMRGSYQCLSVCRGSSPQEQERDRHTKKPETCYHMEIYYVWLDLSIRPIQAVSYCHSESADCSSSLPV
ncbi:uncharacterized protein PV07_03863 [Cladophialophora immunda]|uniref:Uncharacterized protein n=1 Tax=Cladophialophora immunda TaxID=569365 RepID=A0A0D2D9B0_9EURO|nr:uncharacterized protein PV07_03863 [Cladophialophora immunda]KIW32309.1 hypothetical protein PV07_03863 [Cladophialophora immunda]